MTRSMVDPDSRRCQLRGNTRSQPDLSVFRSDVGDRTARLERQPIKPSPRRSLSTVAVAVASPHIPPAGPRLSEAAFR